MKINANTLLLIGGAFVIYKYFLHGAGNNAVPPGNTAPPSGQTAIVRLPHAEVWQVWVNGQLIGTFNNLNGHNGPMEAVQAFINAAGRQPNPRTECVNC